MLDSLAVCGDSFGVGSGISNNPQEMINQSFGAVVSKNYNLPLKIFARSGCCNYVIYLQIKKIIEQYKIKKINPFVLVTTTHHSRFVISSEPEMGFVQYDLSDVDYKTYNFFDNEEDFLKFLPFTPKEQPRLVSETLSNFLHFTADKLTNLDKLFRRVKEKISFIENYYKYIYSDSVKHDYDNSLIVMMHLELKRHNIPHLILVSNQDLENYIDKKNFLLNNWGYYSRKYPDIYNSGHCTGQGHTELAQIIIEKIHQSELME
jgi:hypothetical protein